MHRGILVGYNNICSATYYAGNNGSILDGTNPLNINEIDTILLHLSLVLVNY